MKKGIYLKNTPLEEALKLWRERLVSAGVGPLEGEPVMVKDSLGRVTAEAVIAKISSPFYHSSAMDGYAVRFADTFGASESAPKKLKLGTEAAYVDTGDPLPEGFNAVVMVEDVNIVRSEESGVRSEERITSPLTPHSSPDSPLTPHSSPFSHDFIEIIEPAAPWQNVRIIGEDIVCTELILPENHVIRPVDIGAVISGGHVGIKVRRRPVVTVIPTGSEIVEPGTELKKGNIIEYNSRILCSLVSEWGGEPVRFAPVDDNVEKIKDAILDGCTKADLIVVNAGSSAGSEDFTARAIAELGEVILHGINIKPGSP